MAGRTTTIFLDSYRIQKEINFKQSTRKAFGSVVKFYTLETRLFAIGDFYVALGL